MAWARKFDACLSCGKTDAPHHAHGLCLPCYNKTPDAKRTDAAYYTAHRGEIQLYRKIHKDEFAARDKAYNQNHLEEKRVQRRQYYEAHKALVQAKRHIYYIENRERLLAQKRERRLEMKNGDATVKDLFYSKGRARGHEYYLKNKEQVQASHKAWQQANPERWRALQSAKAIRRHYHLQAVKVGLIDYSMIGRRDRMMCGICHKRVAKKDFSIDHIVPLSKGGVHAEWNLQVAHLRHNIQRGAGRIPAQMRFALDVVN